MKIKRDNSYLLLLSMTGFMAFCQDSFADETKLQCAIKVETWKPEHISIDIKGIPVFFDYNSMEIWDISGIHDRLSVVSVSLGLLIFKSKASTSNDHWYLNYDRVSSINRLSGRFNYTVLDHNKNTIMLLAEGECEPLKQLF